MWKSKGVGWRRKKKKEGRRSVFLRLPYMRADALISTRTRLILSMRSQETISSSLPTQRFRGTVLPDEIWMKEPYKILFILDPP